MWKAESQSRRPIESAQRGHSRESREAANRSGEWLIAENYREAARLASAAKAVRDVRPGTP
jgi:hypothetical protein